MPLQPGLLAVATREMHRIRRDPVARFLLFGVPVIAFVLLGLTFSRAVVRGLDVVVVDRDNSPTSQQFVQTLASSPGITIAERASDLGPAASAIGPDTRSPRSTCRRISARICLRDARRARSRS